MKETKHFKRRGRQRIWAIVLAVVLAMGSVALPATQAEAAAFNSQGVNYTSVLGDARNFGILAKEFNQIAHMQTNYAVIDFGNTGQNSDPDLIEGTTIPFYIAGIKEDSKAIIGKSCYGDNPPDGFQYVVYTTDEAAGQVTPQNIDKKYLQVKTDTYDKRAAVVNGMIKHIKEQSALLSSVTSGTEAVVAPEVKDFNQDELDVSEIDAKVVYVNVEDSTYEKSFKNLLRTGTLTLKKRENQVVVFNIAGEEVSLRMFRVEIVDEDKTLTGDSSSAGGLGAQNQFLLEYIDENIIWNLYEAKSVELRNTAGTFLVPNEKAITRIEGTSTGWLMTAGTATNPAGEWHFPYRVTNYTEPSISVDPEPEPEPLASIKISKRAVGSGDELPGATMALYVGKFAEGNQPSGTPIESWISGEDKDNNGNSVAHEISGDKLSKNTDYTLREVAAPSGYNVATNITFHIDGDGKIVTIGSTSGAINASDRLIVMYDEAKQTDPTPTPVVTPTNVVISKQAVGSTTTELKGATLWLREKTTQKLVDNWVSDGKQSHTISGDKLKLDTEYVLEETAAPNGYQIATQIEFKIDDKGNIIKTNTTFSSKSDIDNGVIVMEDDAIPDLKISKRSLGGGTDDSKELPGAVLELREGTATGNLVEKWVSGKDKNGKDVVEPHTISGSKLKANTTYVLKETDTPDDGIYEIASEIEFTLDAEGNVTNIKTSAALSNKVKEASGEHLVVMFDKVKDSENPNVDPDPTVKDLEISKRSLGDGTKDSEELSDAKLELHEWYDNGKLVDSWTSDGTSHKISADKLKLNTTYVLRESATPDDGKYEIASDITFTIDANGNVKNIATGSVALAKDVRDKSNPNKNLVVMLDRVKGSISKTDEKVVKISKRSLGDGKDFEELPGAKLELRKDSEDGTLIDEWISGSTPHEISSDVLKPGYEYVLVEKQVPDGGKYEIASSIKFKLNGEYKVIEVEAAEATASGADVAATKAYSSGGRSSVDDRFVVMFDKMKTVDVTVNEDGVIKYPDGTEIRPDGTEIDSDGTVTKPDGTIEYPDGGVKKPGNDYVEYPDGNDKYPAGTKVYPDGNKEKEYPAGTIEYPDGGVKKPGNDYVEYPKENKEKEYPAGTKVYPDGNKEKEYPAGTVEYPDGGVKKPGEAVTYPNSGEKKPDGTITYPDGGVKKPGSEDIEYPNGNKKKPDGSIETATGTVIKPDGSIDYPDGSKVDKDGNFIDKDGTVYKPNPANPSNPTAEYDFNYDDPNRVPTPDIDSGDEADKDFMKEFKKKGSNKQDQKNASKALKIATTIKTGDDSADSAIVASEAAPLTKLGAKNTSKVSKKLNSKLKAYRKVYKKQKNQIAGWVTINGTNINYPVMYSGLKNNSKYLHKNIYGKEDTHGMIFASYLTTSRKVSYNYIVYGHNMRDGSMFADLRHYGDVGPSYAKSHRYINVDTSKYNYVYEVVDVVRISCASGSKDGMVYTKFADIGKKKVYNQWKKQVAKCRDSKYKKAFGKYSNKDRLVIFSTCEYTKDNGRIGVICKLKKCAKVKGK